MFLEDVTEVMGVVVTDLEGNVGAFHAAVQQKLFGLLYAHTCQVFDKGRLRLVCG